MEYDKENRKINYDYLKRKFRETTIIINADPKSGIVRYVARQEAIGVLLLAAGYTVDFKQGTVVELRYKDKE